MAKEEDIPLAQEGELSETSSASVFQNNRKGVGSSSDRREDLDGAWWEKGGRTGRRGDTARKAPGVVRSEASRERCPQPAEDWRTS